MRKKIVAGNWKMNASKAEAVAIIKNFTVLMKKMSHASPFSKVTIIIAPPFIHIDNVAQLVNRKRIKIAAQNCAVVENGAYTGEISASMLKSINTDYVILGHSERRTYFDETNRVLAKKLDIALMHGLIPIYCCGETLDERKAEKQKEIVQKQITEGLFHLSPKEFSKIVIAYEPVWAIGTGVTATSDQAQEMHAFIRSVITTKYGKAVSDSISILYGGSCNSKNAKELFACEDVDGGLVGGASLKADEFFEIIQSFEPSSLR
ncbi:MAG: triose-phosphate isomerase [Bacteroidetes bacterium]|nr:triose-phosphate isomerase [Bacteroidota bacterium]